MNYNNSNLVIDFKQNNQRYLSVVLPHNFIDKNSEVLVYGVSPGGYQREPEPNHYNKIKDYIVKTKDFILPTSIVLAVDEEEVSGFLIENSSQELIDFKKITSSRTLGHQNITSAGTNTWSGTNTFSGTTAYTGPVSYASTTVTGLPLSTRVTITSSGTWTVPTGITRAFLFMQGSGGGGGGGGDNNPTDHGGGGGGAGGHITWYPLDVTAGQVYSIVIPAGGAGGVSGAPGTDGSAGGSVTFALLTSPTYTITAGGGAGGQGSQAGAGGAGGSFGTISYTPVPSVTGDGTVQGDYFRTREWYQTTPGYASSGGAGGTTQAAGGNGGGWGGGIGGAWVHDAAAGAGAAGTAGTGSGGGGGGANTGANIAGSGGVGGTGYTVILY